MLVVSLQLRTREMAMPERIEFRVGARSRTLAQAQITRPDELTTQK